MITTNVIKSIKPRRSSLLKSKAFRFFVHQKRWTVFVFDLSAHVTNTVIDRKTFWKRSQAQTWAQKEKELHNAD